MKTIEVKTMYKDVKNELPTNTFECIVKMWNQFNDEWVTGIGIYDVPTGKWEVSSNLGEQYPVHFWFQTPELMTGIGIYDIPTEKWEVSSNLGEQFEVK
jgi:hypothetical protein